jgi:orotidine-5'-phosphate decarboxylase
MDPREKIIAALDVRTFGEAQRNIDELLPAVGIFKVGLELITSGNAVSTIDYIYAVGGNVFYDGKFFDIPNTIEAASREAHQLKVAMFTVHCLSGRKIMQAARRAVDILSKDESVAVAPKILGVTLLTSMDIDDLQEIGFCLVSMKEQVICLARLARASELDGVVASPQEIRLIREACGPEFLIVTPGVRPAGEALHDQKRTMTPGEAIKAGADYVVIGRPFLQPQKGTPLEAAKRTSDEIAIVL